MADSRGKGERRREMEKGPGMRRRDRGGRGRGGGREVGFLLSSRQHAAPSRSSRELSAEWLNLSCIGGIGTLPGWPWLVWIATSDAVCASPVPSIAPCSIMRANRRLARAPASLSLSLSLYALLLYYAAILFLSSSSLSSAIRRVIVRQISSRQSLLISSLEIEILVEI